MELALTTSGMAARSALSSLETKRKCDGPPAAGLSMMRDYLQVLQLEEPLAKLSVIHVAGTKGKGSTCAFCDSILRTCGYSTGLFTSPHLMDVRERFRINGTEVSESTFQEHFWWCWETLKEACTDDLPMPNYFRFLTLLGLRLFISQKVDVALLEVGLGGKYDPTNVIEHPDVCGITCLGFDHMDILGHTLPEIAAEKAGILKPGVPAVTVPQPEDAMAVIEQRALELSIPLQVVQPLDLSKKVQLGLQGEHQLINAALAVALCEAWIMKRGNWSQKSAVENKTGGVPELFKTGLAEARLSGRAQVERDIVNNVTYYLDGAHSPESMEVAAKWFCKTVPSGENAEKILLFNCMPERDPELLFPPLLQTCHWQGVQFHRAMFVPTEDGSDASWQRCLQKAWDTHQGRSHLQTSKFVAVPESASRFSTVMPSLPAALNALRSSARENPSVAFQVLVTGSLHLVGNLLKVLKCAK